MAYANKSLIPQAILDEIVEEVSRISYGSVEIYIQDKQITQITVRNIKKTLNTNGNGHNHQNHQQNSVKTVVNQQSNQIRVLTIKK